MEEMIEAFYEYFDGDEEDRDKHTKDLLLKGYDCLLPRHCLRVNYLNLFGFAQLAIYLWME